MATMPRSPVEILKTLLSAQWFCSAIKLHPNTNLDGEDLREEAEASVAAFEDKFQPGVAYMPVPRCDQCRFWSPPPEGFDKSACVLPKQCFEAGDGGLVWTAAGFGCVQFKKKP